MTLGRPWADLVSILDTLWANFKGTFGLLFSTVSEKPKTLIFNDLTTLLKVFSLPKPLIFRPFFS